MIQRIVSLIALILILALAASPGATAQEGPAGNFYLRRALDQEDLVGSFPVRFSINFGSTFTAACVNKEQQGCQGILKSAERAVALVISRKTSATKLQVGDPSNNKSESKTDTILRSGSIVFLELNVEGLPYPYLTLSFLIDVHYLAAGSELEDVRDSVVSAVEQAADDQSLIEDISNFMKTYDGDDLNGIDYHKMMKGGQSSSVGQETVFDNVELVMLNEETQLGTEEEIKVYTEVETQETQGTAQEEILDPPSEEITEVSEEVNKPEAVKSKAAEEEEEEKEPMHLVTKLMLIGSFGFLFCMIPSKVWK